MNAPPYRRSWVDAVIAGIEKLPGPPWLFYLGGSLLFTAVGTGVTWIDGSQPIGTFTFVRVFNDAYAIYPLAVMHFLTVTAGKAIAAFRPALGVLEADYDRLAYQFTHMRRSHVNVVTIAIGASYVAASLLADPEVAGLNRESSILSWVVLGSFGFVAGILFTLVVFFIARLLVLILRIHAKATAVDLYDAPTHGAFARLTLRSSFLLALPVYVYTTYSIALGSPREGIAFSDLVAVIVQVAGAIAVFFIPLWGMNRRLVAIKAGRVTQINHRLAATGVALHARADSGELDGVGDLNTLQSALLTERDIVKRLSTWPWEAETIRGFLSSIALPIVVWLATNLLSRFLGG